VFRRTDFHLRFPIRGLDGKILSNKELDRQYQGKNLTLIRGFDMALSDDEEFYLRRVMHENDLVNHRITWFITLQGLLFAALSFSWGKTDAKNLIFILGFLGILTSASSAFVLWGGANAIEELLSNSTITKALGRKSKWYEKYFYPWYSFPLLFATAWAVILFVK
jgi:hypothetical protein